jgi:hypothetical protein
MWRQIADFLFFLTGENRNSFSMEDWMKKIKSYHQPDPSFG